MPVRPVHIISSLGLLAAICIASCTKTIEVDLNTTDPKLVIEGQVLSTPGPYYVTLSKTVNFSSPNKFPPVSGAVIKITDKTAGLTNQLKEVKPGRYATKNIKGTPGHQYQLSVVYKGQKYQANSTMPKPVTLDSVSFSNLSLFGDDNVFAEVNFDDPVDQENYYTFDQYINGVHFHDATFVISDRLSDGRRITQPLFTDSAFIKKGDSVSIQMHCVDKRVYDYFNTLSLASSPEAGTPANPVSNISGKKTVLGYFSAQTVSENYNIADR